MGQQPKADEKVVPERLAAARRLLDASERKYAFLIENLPGVVVWSTNALGSITFVSANVEAICGFTPEELVARSPDSRFDRVHPDDTARVRAAFESLEVGRTETLDIEYRTFSRDMKWLTVRSRAKRARDEHGVGSIDGISSDVTDRKHLQEQLSQAQKLEVVIGELMASVAHDLNNVLAVIMSSAEFLRESLGDDDERHRDVADIETAIHKATALTKRLHQGSPASERR